MELIARSVAESIDLDAFASVFGNESVSTSKRELFYAIGKNSWVSVYSCGAVAFCNLREADETGLIELAKKAGENVHINTLSEDHTVRIGKGSSSFKTSAFKIFH